MTDDGVFRGPEEPGGGYGWEKETDLKSISEEELRARLRELALEGRGSSPERGGGG